jgi:hypothetical protein
MSDSNNFSETEMLVRLIGDRQPSLVEIKAMIAIRIQRLLDIMNVINPPYSLGRLIRLPDIVVNEPPLRAWHLEQSCEHPTLENGLIDMVKLGIVFSLDRRELTQTEHFKFTQYECDLPWELHRKWTVFKGEGLHLAEVEYKPVYLKINPRRKSDKRMGLAYVGQSLRLQPLSVKGLIELKGEDLKGTLEILKALSQSTEHLLNYCDEEINGIKVKHREMLVVDGIVTTLILK